MSRLRRIVSWSCFFLSGIFVLLAAALLGQRQLGWQLIGPVVTPVQAEEPPAVALPVRLVIPDLRIDVPIVPGRFINREWQLSDQAVSLLSDPTWPSGHGYVFYGHNWNSLFGNLHQAVPGQKLTLIYNDGTIQHYLIDSSFTVSPEQLEVLNYATADHVLLYTCSGWLDLQRLVVIARQP